MMIIIFHCVIPISFLVIYKNRYEEVHIMEFLWTQIIPHFLITMRMAQFLTLVFYLTQHANVINLFYRSISASIVPFHQREQIFCEFYLLFRNCCKLIGCINEMFGWSMLACFTYDLICIVLTCYEILFYDFSWIKLQPAIAPICNLFGLTILCHLNLSMVSIYLHEQYSLKLNLFHNFI